MRYVYMSRGASIDSPPRFNSGHDYITTESHFNASYYARSLPPVPQHCPTPMGVAGNHPNFRLVAFTLTVLSKN